MTSEQLEALIKELCTAGIIPGSLQSPKIEFRTSVGNSMDGLPLIKIGKTQPVSVPTYVARIYVDNMVVFKHQCVYTDLKNGAWELKEENRVHVLKQVLFSTFLTGVDASYKFKKEMIAKGYFKP